MYPFENASPKKARPVQQEIILESVTAQLEFLEAASRRHLLWANSAKDGEIRDAHLEIVYLMEQTRQQYHHLLDYYRKLT